MPNTSIVVGLTRLTFIPLRYRRSGQCKFIANGPLTAEGLDQLIEAARQAKLIIAVGNE